MPPRKRIIRRHAGWLAIPASLLLAIAALPSLLADATEPPAVESSVVEDVFSTKAEYVVLTFFDLYCLACQQSADNFNLLHQRLGDVFPSKGIEVTGIGIGDTAFELDVFQRKYKLLFRSLPDPEKTFEQPFSIRGTPTVLVFKLTGTGHKEIYRHEGRFRQSDIDELIKGMHQHKS